MQRSNKDKLTNIRLDLPMGMSSWDDFDNEDWGEDMFASSGNQQPVGDVEKKCIFVGNLPFETTDQDLRLLAEEKGVSADAILSSRIATKFNGRSRGFGYLEFSTSETASENLEALMKASREEEGLRIGDRALKLDLDVGLDGPKKGRRHARTNTEFSLFLGNLDFSCDSLIVEDFIREMVAEKVTRELNIARNKEQMRQNRLKNTSIDEEEDETTSDAHVNDGNNDDIYDTDDDESIHGTTTVIKAYLSTPVRVKIAKDLVSGRSRGFGQAYFESAQSRDFALEALQMSELNGRELTVAVTKKRGDNDWGSSGAPRRERERKEADPEARNSKSIFLGNLPFDATADSVVDLMEDVLGPNRIISVRLAQDPYTGRSKGYGHLDLKSSDDCERAVSVVHGMKLSGRPLTCDFATNSSKKAPAGSQTGPRSSSGGGVARRGGNMGPPRRR